MGNSIRALVNELGQAVYRSAAESPEVVAVTEKLRAAGFITSLCLEATIFLDRIEGSSAQASATPAENGDTCPSAFTTNDTSFLQSLRISLTDEPAKGS